MVAGAVISIYTTVCFNRYTLFQSIKLDTITACRNLNYVGTAIRNTVDWGTVLSDFAGNMYYTGHILAGNTVNDIRSQIMSLIGNSRRTAQEIYDVDDQIQVKSGTLSPNWLVICLGRGQLFRLVNYFLFICLDNSSTRFLAASLG